jgi:glycosyltransferase involved in cell wall biosynthesis
VKLRVCNIAKHIYPPSLNGHAQNLETFRALSRYFDEIRLIVQSADQTARTERIDNIYIYQVPRIKWSGIVNHMTFIGRAFLHSYLLCRKGKVDVCDASEPLSGGVVACLLRRVTGVPCLVELQGDGLEFEAGVHPPVRELLFRSIIRTVVRQADHIRAISERVASQARRAGVDESRITIATSRVNMRRFQGRGSTGKREVLRRDHDIVNDKIVGCVTRLHPLKGLAVLVQAWPLVAAKVPDATLVIVGDGPEREHLTRLASDLVGHCRIVFVGACHYDDVPAWLDAFDVFVLPSLTEGTPRALLEAMAMELPVVATSVGDIPQAVLDHSSGLVVPPRDAEALADAIVELLADPARAAAMGRSARATVLRQFGFTESIRNLALSHYRAAGRPFPHGA